MYGKFKNYLQQELENIKEDGLYKNERILTTPQGVQIKTVKGLDVLNFCSNNYLGLSSEPRVMAAANYNFFKFGFGMASVRFICGTQEVHKELENKLTEFLGTEDTILYSSAFDANGGVFEPLLDEKSAIISDELNHASIIDGIRLCKAQRFRYKNNDMSDLEAKLKEAKDCRFKMIVTDGVFSMDGIIASIDQICDLADKYEALVLVDDSHASGFVGKTGRGSAEFCNSMGRVDIITTTFGKALGGASGGCVSGKKEIIDFLRQRSRPYLFSNSLAPAIAGATVEVLNILNETTALRDKLAENTKLFRQGMENAGFTIVPGTHPITPILFGHLPNDARLSQEFADELLEEGIYVIGFYYPIVPKGKSRIRVQITAAHSTENIEFAIEKFKKVGKKLGAI
ncbi:MAG: glycine C-acetyltransferase [Bacteroidetes bacterium]|jgi:glycine C-acetyltransferase|nr:glycine C-acetyltransferase [Bacteroidota bacterium]MBT6685686.1 glycine C-acetyltransferase [Bacteroidota bacterium]MBT7141910.1 glycine C-acetyltransferase [Bacteroidota bacterium]MBT7493044.1 glycine C-acetyltransferase [Bacteroidota bacterium]